ncbi:DUF5605 domain-containing protein [Actinopolymorpha sp. B11F2]|uniref:DUF5605 domain-containing protein n=1 Tax=Actinopolymorpha sp. B11F2 TaxID=3160862 RepID=UPI0032E37B37
MSEQQAVECWDVVELDARAGEAAVFERAGRAFFAEPFDDGGRHRVRFLPDEPGEWTYTFNSGRIGTVVCTPPAPDNHGPVRVDGLRFRYADGTTYIPVGTTAFWWYQQDAGRRSQTMSALAGMGVSKVRMSILPAGREDWPNHRHLACVEAGVRDLRERGVAAELVLFHAGEDPVRASGPGIGWQGYVREAVSRLAAYRNVSWCIATDADQVAPPPEGWEEVLRTVQEYDYGHHLLTLHGGPQLDFGQRPLTHASVRHDQVRVVSALTDALGKPVVVDSCGYEGDAQAREASLTAGEMVVRLWEATCRGGFASHGEWYAGRGGFPGDGQASSTGFSGADDAAPWWVAGGRPVGAAADRVAFLRTVMESAPPDLRRRSEEHDASTLELPGIYYLQYYGPHRFRSREFQLPPGSYRVSVLDTWAMTIDERPGTCTGTFVLELPGKAHQAVRIERC